MLLGLLDIQLRVYFRYRGTHDLKQTVAQANAALYVTEYQLQKRYPISNSVFSISASNVQICSCNLPSSGKNCIKRKELQSVVGRFFGTNV